MPERHSRALRQLLQLHLLHAKNLSLMDGVSTADIDSFGAPDRFWGDASLEPHLRFGHAVESAKLHFAGQWRYRVHRPCDVVELSRVIPLADLHYSLHGTAAPREKAKFRKLVEAFVVLRPQLKLSTSHRFAPSAQRQLLTVLQSLQIALAAPTGKPFRTLASGIHGPGSCWVALPVSARRPTVDRAQYWRDRLGLHHLPSGSTLGDQLMRLTFTATLSKSPCPQTVADYVAVRSSSSRNIWLARPTAGDVPNPRFAQANLVDSVTNAAPTGQTIDLSSDSYAEAEPELIMLRGQGARLNWHNLELLDGMPSRHPRDENHEAFHSLIANRHLDLSKTDP